MKLNHKYQIKGLLLASVMVIGTLYSCDDDFLEKKPLNAVSEADVWTDIPLVEAYVNQTYATLRAGYWANSRWDISSDDGFGTEKGDAHLIQRGEVTPSNMGYLEDPWEEHYVTITNCNKFLEKMTDETLAILKAENEERTDRMVGEMKFLRAYSYFRLLSFFGGVPLITTPFKLGDDYLVERNSYQEVLDFVVSELDAAAELLPPSYSGADLGRITEGAAMAIKSRALLYAASPLHNPENDLTKWQKASDAAKAVIDLNRYSLYPDYKESFTEVGNFNQERIWEYVLNQDLLYSGEYRIERKMFPNGSKGWGHPSPTQNLVDSYEMTSGLLPEDDGSYDAQNPYVNRDPRFYASILYNGAPWQGRQIEVFRPGGADSPDGNEGWNASWTGYYIRKYVDESILSPTNTNSSNPNWIFARYGEILLNYAEAEFYLGHEDVARTYLNMIRSRPSVNMPDVLDSGPALEKRIRNERRVELYAEEHRFFDIRRWKLEGDDFLYKVNVAKNETTGEETYSITELLDFGLSERTYLAPIPQDEITKNPLLDQNPGYDQ